MSFRVASLALGQSYDCSWATETIRNDFRKIDRHPTTKKRKKRDYMIILYMAWLYLANMDLFYIGGRLIQRESQMPLTSCLARKRSFLQFRLTVFRNLNEFSPEESVSVWHVSYFGYTVSGLILGVRTANERRRYFVRTSLIGWTQT